MFKPTNPTLNQQSSPQNGKRNPRIQSYRKDIVVLGEQKRILNADESLTEPRNN